MLSLNRRKSETMKRIYTILLIASTLFFFACQQEDNLAGGATGYLRLTVNEDMSTNSRADVPEDYKPEQIAVQIVNAEGETVEETEDWGNCGKINPLNCL